MTFQIGVSRLAKGKDGYKRNKFEFGNSFRTETHDLDSLAHLLAVDGYAVTMVHHRNPPGPEAQARGITTYRHTENFISMQVPMLDDDRQQPGVIDFWLGDDFFRQYGAFIYESDSSRPEAQKARPVFILDRPLTDPADVKEALKALRHHYPFVDNIHDAARVWYGSPGARIHRIGNILPYSILQSHIIVPYLFVEEERRREENQRRLLREANCPKPKYAMSANPIAGIVDYVASRTEGERHGAVLWAGRKIPPGTPGAESQLLEACGRNGYRGIYPDSEILRVFHDGQRLAGGNGTNTYNISISFQADNNKLETAPAPEPWESALNPDTLESLQAGLAAEKKKDALWADMDILLSSDIDPEEVAYHRDRHRVAKKWREYVRSHYPDLDAEAEYRRKLAENRIDRQRICYTTFAKPAAQGDQKIGYMRCGYCDRCRRDQGGLVKQKIKADVSGYDWLDPTQLRDPVDIAYFRVEGRQAREYWVRQFTRRSLDYQVFPIGPETYDILGKYDPGLDELLPNEWRFLDPVDLTEERLLSWVTGCPGERGSGSLVGNVRELYKDLEEPGPYEVDRRQHRREFAKTVRAMNKERKSQNKGKLTKAERDAVWQEYLNDNELIELETRGVISPQAEQVEFPPCQQRVTDVDELQEALTTVYERYKRKLVNQGGVVLGVIRNKILTPKSTLPALIEDFNRTQAAKIAQEAADPPPD